MGSIWLSREGLTDLRDKNIYVRKLSRNEKIKPMEHSLALLFEIMHCERNLNIP